MNDSAKFLTRFILAAFASIFFCRVARVAETANFHWEQDDRSATLYDGDKMIFAYQYAFIDHYPATPEKEPRRFAGCYIHPLVGLSGEILTDDAPKDHFHHHGAFWTWPGVFVHKPSGVEQYDLWTSNTKIRQRFVKFIEKSVASDVAVLEVENGWYVGEGAIKPDELIDSQLRGEEIARNEPQYGEKIIVERARIETRPIETIDGFATRAVDFELTLTPQKYPVSLQGAEHKSYGGFSIRFRPSGAVGVDRFIATDEGVAKDDMPEKNLRWADYTSRFGAIDPTTSKSDAFSGAAIFLSPNFPDFPPTWLTRYYGPLCVGFPGVVAQRFEPGAPVVMKARILLHEGRPSLETLKRAYEAWAEREKTDAVSTSQ